METVICVKPLARYLTVGKTYRIIDKQSGYYFLEDDRNKPLWFRVGYFGPICYIEEI